MTDRRIHAAGLFGGSGKRRTWCGRLVDDEQLPIIGTGRDITCLACMLTNQAHGHARRWGYSYKAKLRRVLRRRERDA